MRFDGNDLVPASMFIGLFAVIVIFLLGITFEDCEKTERVRACVQAGGTWTADGTCEQRGAR